MRRAAAARVRRRPSPGEQPPAPRAQGPPPRRRPPHTRTGL